MITAGDEFARTQRGNNNAYCHDSALTWLPWEHAPWQEALADHVRTLTRLRRENAALRPRRFASAGERVPGASVMQWYDVDGRTMTGDAWTSPAHRTLQYVAASTPDDGDGNRILLIVHGTEQDTRVTLPVLDDATVFTSLWSSAEEHPDAERATFAPGDVVDVPGTSMHLFRVS
jgi:glycogen debranching enzyme